MEDNINDFITKFANEHKYIPPAEYISQQTQIDIQKIKIKILQMKTYNNTFPIISLSQFKVLSCIEKFIEKHGYSPTVRELCKLTGYSSTSTIHGHIKRLAEKNLISKVDFMPRTITETDENLISRTFNDKEILDLLNGINIKNYSVTNFVIQEISKSKMPVDKQLYCIKKAIAIDKCMPHAS